MVEYCNSCDRGFINYSAILQHWRTSINHDDDYCRPCDRLFGNLRAKKLHEESIAHHRRAYNLECPRCLFFCDYDEDMDDHKEQDHFWCKTHDKFCEGANNFRAHMNSKAHAAPKVSCPYCSLKFVSYSARTLHWESGTCNGGINRRIIDKYIHKHDPHGFVTLCPVASSCSNDEIEADIWATSDTWNGRYYECEYCGREYKTLSQLNGHITIIHAPKRTEKLYYCCDKDCQRTFEYFSGLVQHVESRSCNVYKVKVGKFFDHGRLISYPLP